MPEQKTAQIHFGLKGMVSKIDPSLLADGAYRYLLNMETFQEGALSSRSGRRLLGYTPSGLGLSAYAISKTVIKIGENPLVPADNLRYIGLASGAYGNLYRTTDYSTFSLVSASINTSIGTSSKRFTAAPYSPGFVGAPWTYIASELKMLKDKGDSPYATLPAWGVLPAFGVATAVVVTGSIGISAIGTYDSGGGIAFTLASAAGLADYDKITPSGVDASGLTVTTTDGRTTLDGTSWDVRIGVTGEGNEVINADTMFRIYDANGQGVTINTGAYTSGGSITNGPTLGVLDGGSNNSPNESQPYDYRFIYRADATNNPGNPSQTMLVASDVVGGTPVTVHYGQITVTVQGTDDPQISQTTPSIEIYRRGGILYDTWRKLTEVINPGAGATETFIDNIADADLAYAAILEVDNDPPVTSTVSEPIKGTLDVIATAGRQAVAASGTLTKITPGTLLHVYGTKPEDVIVEEIGSGTITAYFQKTHAASDPWEVDAICGQPCHLVVSFGQFLLVAGDPNNPHIIYRSKGDQPEAFPVAPADGSVSTAAAGSPSNPIMAMCEFRGLIFTLNLYSIFETAVINGSLQNPVQVAYKGVVGPKAWCRTQNEIWFMATDGVWSWDGGALRKRSEAIDPIFHDQYANGLYPVSRSHLDDVIMETRRGRIYVIYVDSRGLYNELVCDPDYEDRWVPIGTYSPALVLLFREQDTDSLIGVRGAVSNVEISIEDALITSTAGVNYTADGFTTIPVSGPITTGSAIPFETKLPWFDFGRPDVLKNLTECLLEISADNVTEPKSTLSVDVYKDYSDTAVATVTITLPAGRAQLLSIISQVATSQCYGVEARAFSFRIYGTAYPARITLHSLTVRYEETGALVAATGWGWDNLSHPWDKRLYVMTVEFDALGIDHYVTLDTISGKYGATYTEAVQTFKLSKNSAVIKGGGIAVCNFAVTDGTIVKEVRVRPTSAETAGKAATSLFKVHRVDFEKEPYPPDAISFTADDDGGSEFDKYLNQICLEVNTNNQPVIVIAQADGVDKFTFTVTSTERDRKRNITVPTGKMGKKWRLYIDPTQTVLLTGTGLFQLFNNAKGSIFKFQPADRGEVGTTFDWDDLNHPWDKLLSTVTVEWDAGSPISPIVMQLDTLGGIGGQVLTSAVATYQLAGGRGKAVFPIPVDTVAKMIRFYPIGTPGVNFKQWKYVFDKTDFPADIINVTPWKVAEPNDVEPSWLWLDADTANVAATVRLQNENGTVLTVSHTGTLNNRKKNYAIPAGVHAKMWRILPTQGTGGKYQSFGWGFERWHPFDLAGPVDPPEIVLFTPWQDQGYPYGKLARTMVLTINTGGVDCVIELQSDDGGTLQTFVVNTTYTSRSVILACNPNLTAVLWRLVLTPGTGGLAQLWSWALDAVKEPPAITQWSSYRQAFGYVGWKFIMQVWLEYVCASPVSMTITSDTGAITIVFPAKTTRGVERRYPGATTGAGVNKSLLYDVSFSAATAFKIYPDQSGLELILCSADRRGAYAQVKLSSFLQVPV